MRAKNADHRARSEFEIGRELAARGDAAAIPHLRFAARQDPALKPLALLLLGGVLASNFRFAEAIRVLREGLYIAPQLAAMHNTLAFPLLLLGDYEAGWEEYEWRRYVVGFPQIPGSEWKGESLEGKTILVHSEQGLGDCLMLARYLPLLAQQGAQVILACERPLIPLLKEMPGVARAIWAARRGRLPGFDYWVFMASLPRLFGTRIDTIPSGSGYLTAVTERVQAWAGLLPAGRKVGLVWGGNPELMGDDKRSIPFALLAPLLDVRGMTFVSLQLGPRRDEIANRTDIVDVAGGLADFSATAAVVANLDLIIAVDTAVAHLAGAMGKPTWIMLPYAPDWRWMLKRKDSVWYASVRLFRQKRPDDWKPVIAQVAASLRQRFSARENNP